MNHLPRSMGDNADVLRMAANATTEALKHNANVFRRDDCRIDVNALLPRLLEILLGDTPGAPERPAKVDQFSALVGAATVLAISKRQGGSTDWIMTPPPEEK